MNEKQEGLTTTVFDFARRLAGKAVNKKVVESLALGGGFDCFEEVHRAQFFTPSEKYDTFGEHLLKYGQAYQANKVSAATSLFGDTEDVMIPEPKTPKCEPWSLIESLNREVEVTGIFVSGHPLDVYRLEIENFTTCSLDRLDDLQKSGNQAIKVAGLITMGRHLVSKNGNGWGIFEIKDFNSGIEFRLFGEDYQKFKHLLEEGKALFLTGGFQKSWRGEQMEFKIKNVQLLEGISESLTKSITLKLRLDKLTPGVIDRIDSLCQTFPGDHQLKMILLDPLNKLTLNMYAKEKRVNASNDFVQELDQLGIEFKLN